MPALIEPGLLPSSGILFVGGEPKVGKSILVANLALALASGSSRAGFHVPAARRVLICQFELPCSQFAQRLAPMRQPIGKAADSNLLLLRPSPQAPTVELRFQFRYAPATEPRLLTLDAETLWFDACTSTPPPLHARRKVETADVQRALTDSGSARFNQLRQQIM